VSEPSLNYGRSFLLSTIQALQQQDQAAEGPREELQQYLKTGTESTTDIIGWWGVSPMFFGSNSDGLIVETIRLVQRL
jgi:hypothetical protein